MKRPFQAFRGIAAPLPLANALGPVLARNFA